jgi:hypothetical protein
MVRLHLVKAIGMCLAICLIGAGLLVTQRIEERASYNYKTLAHLKRIGVMFQLYHDKKGHFPPAYVADATGRRLHGWRTLLLEVELPELFSRIKLSEP